MEEVVLSECYYAGWIGWGLGYILFSPWILLVGMNVASMLYGTDGSLLIYYNVSVTFNFWFSYILSITLRERRPEVMEECGVYSYGLPDPNMVSIFTFTFVLAATGLTHRIRLNLATSVIFLMLGLLYSFSLWYNVHLSTTQALFSFALSCFLAAFWFVIYYTFLAELDDYFANISFLRAFGANTTWSVKRTRWP